MRRLVAFLSCFCLLNGCSDDTAPGSAPGQGGSGGTGNSAGASVGGTGGSENTSQGGSSNTSGSSGSGGESGHSGTGGSITGGAGGNAGSSGTSGTSGQGGSSGASGVGGSSGSSGNSGSGGNTGSGPYFTAGAWFYEDVSNAAVASDSAAITQWMEGHSPPGGWGTGTLRTDFSIVVNHVPADTEKMTYETNADYYYPPDCDYAPVPIPHGGAVEETYGTPTDFSMALSGYNCYGYDDGDDCHLLMHAPNENRLYEIYHATIRQDGSFEGGCLAIWDTSVVPSETGRGDQCSSADAAGFPIAPLLFNADEIAAGHIDHAIRLILPNAMIREMQFVRPATHSTFSTSGPQTSIPYGGHFRLRADYPLETLSPSAQVVARALQTYGMYVADGGNIALTAESDLLTTHKWEEVGFDAYSLQDLRATDFDVIDHGPAISWTTDCVREQITQ